MSGERRLQVHGHAAQGLRWEPPREAERYPGEPGDGPARVLVSHDGRYRFWRESAGSRHCWRWAQREWSDHTRGCFHGAAATLAEAVAATDEHREEYANG